jgi:hypothetical protein
MTYSILSFVSHVLSELMDITVTILDIIHPPAFHLITQRFGGWVPSPSAGGTYSDGPRRNS